MFPIVTEPVGNIYSKEKNLLKVLAHTIMKAGKSQVL